MHKKDVEEFLKGKGDYIQINHLERYLKIMPPMGMRKFAYEKLAEIYLKKEMFNDAAKMLKNVALSSVTFREKRIFYLKEAKAYILGMKFDESDMALKRAMVESNSREKKELQEKIIEFYKKQITELESKGKKEKCIKYYEKLIKMEISPEDKEDIREKLLVLYDKLGMTKEYEFLKSVGA